jgi:hypothetical protein
MVYLPGITERRISVQTSGFDPAPQGSSKVYLSFKQAVEEEK